MTLLELFKLMRKHLKLVIALPLICAFAVAVVSWGFMQNQYTATVSVYVLASSSSDSASSSAQYSDLTASQLMANDISALAKSDLVEDRVAEALGMADLKGYKVSVSSSTTTRLIDISVTGANAGVAAQVANEAAAVLDAVSRDVMGVENINVVDAAKIPVDPSGPARKMYVVVALLAGLFIALAIVVLQDMFDTRVRSAEDAEKLLGIPVIGRIPTIRH